MEEYIKRFNESYISARSLKKEIYSLKKSNTKKDMIWESIVELCLSSKKCKWYYEEKRCDNGIYKDSKR